MSRNHFAPTGSSRVKGRTAFGAGYIGISPRRLPGKNCRARCKYHNEEKLGLNKRDCPCCLLKRPCRVK